VQQQILAKNPAADLRVYAVWFNMLPGDHRLRWDGAGLTDPRVVHLWDEQKLAGTWFAERVDGRAGIAWDVYYLYGPQAQWEAEPGPLVSSGRTIIARRAQLESSIATLLGAGTTP
jgi:hypothetical protein